MPNQYKVTKFQNTVTSTAQLFFTATATTTLIKSVLVNCDGKTSVSVELYIKKFGSTNTLLKRYTITSGDDSYNMLSDVLPLEDKDELWVSSSDLDSVWLASYVESTTTTTATSVRNLPDWSDSLPTADGQVPTWNVSLGEYQPTTLDVSVDLIDLDDTPSDYGAPGQVLATNGSSNGTEWVTVTQGGGGSVETVNSVFPDQSGNVILDTDDIEEGNANLYYTNNRVDARVTALDLADQTYVDTQVVNEESARIAADTALQGQITVNSGDIDQLETDLAAETALRIAADSALQGGIDTNAGAITTEAGLRASADSDLQSQISSNDGDITALDGRLTTAEGEIDALQAATHVDTLNGLSGAITLSPGSNVTLTQVGNDIEISSSGGGGGGGGSDSFNTFTVPTQPDVVADSGNDTMNFVDGVGINMTTDNTTKTITFSVDGLGDTDLAYLNVWRGNVAGVPEAVNQSSLSVGTAAVATNAINANAADTIEVNSTTSGTYRILLGDDTFIAGADVDVYANLVGGFTYNVSGGVVGAGAFSATNNVTAGGALIGGSLDISGNADIDGTLQLGGIVNVENEINQNASDIAALQAIPQYAPVVTETASFIIEDDTYEGKFVVCNSSSVIEVELEDSATYPANVGDEIYFMQQGTGQVQIIPLGSTTLQAPGNLTKTRAQYSTIGIKYLGSNVWVVMGDLGV